MLSPHELEIVERSVADLDSLERINFLLEMEKKAQERVDLSLKNKTAKEIEGCFTSLAFKPGGAKVFLDILDRYVEETKGR